MGCGTSDLQTTRPNGLVIPPRALTWTDLVNESEEAERERLSKYGTFRESYTVKEITEHNNEKGHCELFCWKCGVHHSEAFKEVMMAEVLAQEHAVQIEDPSYFDDDSRLNFSCKWEINPILMVNGHAKLKMTTIIKYIPKSKVSNLHVLSNKEYWSDIKDDADNVACDLNEKDDIGVYELQYLELLRRFFDQFEELCNDYSDKGLISFGDPNDQLFPLPKAVEPESVRDWIVNYEPLDFEVPEKGCWSVWPQHQIFEPGEIAEYIPWYDPDIPDFDMEISGETGWEVIAPDLVKNDVTTEQQDNILKSREKRTDMNDPERMKTRREEIAKYFIKVYEWPASKLDPFLRFSDTLEQGWRKFQELC